VIWEALGFMLPIVIQVLMFIAGWNFHKAKVRRRYQALFPYRWLCREEHCGFEFASNDMGLVDHAATGHQRDHARGQV